MNDLKDEYSQRLERTLRPLAKAAELQLRMFLDGQPRIDRIMARAKDLDRFLMKADIIENGTPKYKDPLRQIQDQVGARVVVFYRSDVESVSRVIEKYYRPIEARDRVPESEWEFGYFGRHYVLLVPSDLRDMCANKKDVPEFFELQVKTMFQHAWSEANHDLGYKPGLTPLSPDAKRRLAFTSAQAWGADRIFDELFREVSE